MSNSYLETKITINHIALIVIGALLAVGFTAGAFVIQQWLWLIAPPMDVIGIALVIIGGRRRRQTQGSRGMAISVLGGAFIVGSIWAAFMLGNAFPT
ncbi:hypothetical protein V6K52_06955 [Knoellia sp. S7-12]|uniref:hypothetical protein n=1 Tax=Knoellia sp. S7-12 TaxID=3126698 RepID=UPI003369254E